MRRIVLLAGLFTAIAGGAAAFAASDTGPAAPGPAPDPYLGTWALTIDGVLAGPVATVDGCSVGGEVVADPPGPDRVAGKHLARTDVELCTVEVGLGMSKGFYGWLSSSLAGTESAHSMQLVRIDGKPGYALELMGATARSLTLPRLDRASVSPVFLKLALGAELIRRTAAPTLPKEAALPPRAIAPAALDVKLGGTLLETTAVGPWTATMPEPSARGGREYGMVSSPAEVGNLPLRVPETAKTQPVATLDGWLQAAMSGAKGTGEERPIVVGLYDGRGRVELAFDHAGPVKGDLAPRADGARNYVLYAERAAIAGG